MRNRMVIAGILCGMSCWMSGCQTPNAALAVPVTEDFVAPPNEPRYNQPPESGYRMPPPKKVWGSQPTGGGGGPSMSGM